MKKYLIVLLSAIMIISCTTVLIACSSKEDNKPNTPQEQTQQLIAPSNLAINNQTVSWATVINANGYTVRVGSTEHSVASGTSFDLSLLTLDDGTYQISVKAIGQTVGNIKYTDSAYSTAVDYVAKASIKEGTYRLTSITYDGKTYDMTKTDEVRSFYKVMSINEAIETYQIIYPWYDFNDLPTLKLLFSGLFDFTSITTSEQFWDALIEFAISTEISVKNELDAFIKVMTTFNITIANDKMSIYYDGGISPSTTFTLNNGVITLANPSVVGFEDSTLTYTNGIITVTDSDSYDAVSVAVFELTTTS